jgi:hypothetical protein
MPRRRNLSATDISLFLTFPNRTNPNCPARPFLARKCQPRCADEEVTTRIEDRCDERSVPSAWMQVVSDDALG